MAITPLMPVYPRSPARPVRGEGAHPLRAPRGRAGRSTPPGSKELPAMAITPLMPVYPRSPVRPVRGEGAYLIGEQGEKYLDFASGIAVNLLGHGHPHLTQASQEQAAKLSHV